MWLAKCIALRLENKPVGVQLVCLKFCRIASERSIYSNVLILLVAGGQAECIMDSELKCIVLVRIRLVFSKAISKGLERIDSGLVVLFANLLWQALPKDSVISRV